MNKTTNVLFIEDLEDDVILMLHHIKQEFSNLNYDWVDSKVKLVKILESEKNWDIIICDNSLPQLDGHEAVKIIRENGIQTPIICVSGSGILKDESKCLEAGAAKFIDKTQLDELVDTIKKILSKKK